MKRFLVTLVVSGLVSSLTGAEFYIKTKHNTSAFEIMGQHQQAQEEILEQWITPKGMVSVMPIGRVIIDNENDRFILINPDDKTYIETGLPLDMKTLLPPEMSQMAEMMKSTVKVTPTGQTKKIGEWNCKGYDVAINMMMMQMKNTVWASTDVPFDWKEAAKMNANLIKLQGQFLDDEAIKELMKIEGAHIRSETVMNVMGSEMKTVTEVVEISEKSMPPEMFEIPDGYKKTEKINPTQMQK